MARVLIIDTENVGLSFAWRCVLAGHEVRWFTKQVSELDKELGKGFKGVEKTENWVGSVQWADLIFPTSNGDFMERLDFFKDRGAPVFAGTVKSSRLELNPIAGCVFLQEHDIHTPAYFDEWVALEDIETTVRALPARYVVKVVKHNRVHTYVAQSPADLINWARRQNVRSVFLQKFVEGVPIVVTRWMGPYGWANISQEAFSVTSQNGVASYVSKSEVGDRLLNPIENSLMSLGHVGAVSVKAIVDATGKLWATSCACHPLWPMFNLHLAAAETDPVQWMINMLHGDVAAQFKSVTGCYTVLSGNEAHVPIYGVNRRNKKYIHPLAIKIDRMADMEDGEIVEHPVWNTAGRHAVAVTGFGESVQQAVTRAEKTSRQINATGFKTNEKARPLKEDLQQLHKFGYFKTFQYEV